MKQKKTLTALAMAGMTLSLVSCQHVQGTVNEVLKKEAVSDGKDTVEQFQSDGTIKETVMVDESDIRITATDLSYTDYDVRLNLTIENNSDKELSFVTNSLGYSCNSINGYMIQDGYMNADVLAGKKTNETIRFGLDELSIYGITEIADIQIGFRVTDEDYDSVYQGVGQVKTSAAASYDYGTDTYAKNLKSGAVEKLTGCSVDYYSDEELYNQGGIRIISDALVTNKDGEQTVLIELVNDSSDVIYGTTSDMALNGMVVYSALWSSDAVAPQTRCVVGLSLSKLLDEAYWDLLGISEIGEISFTFAGTDGAWGEVTPSQEVSILLKKKTDPINDKGEEVYSKNGVRIISKGLIEDPSEYSDDIHMLFLVENNSAGTIEMDDTYDSLSVNGYMIDYICSSRKIPAGKYALVDVEIDDLSLRDSGIVGVAGISDAEITFEIEDGDRNEIEKTTVLMRF